MVWRNVEVDRLEEDQGGAAQPVPVGSDRFSASTTLSRTRPTVGVLNRKNTHGFYSLITRQEWRRSRPRRVSTRPQHMGLSGPRRHSGLTEPVRLNMERYPPMSAPNAYFRGKVRRGCGPSSAFPHLLRRRTWRGHAGGPPHARTWPLHAPDLVVVEQQVELTGPLPIRTR